MSCLLFVSLSTASSLLPSISSITPLSLSQFALELKHHPDKPLVSYVLDGLQNGFRIGFSCPHLLRSATRNKPSTYQHARVIDEYLANEVRLGRVAGPFSSPPCFNVFNLLVIIYLIELKLSPREQRQRRGADAV